MASVPAVRDLVFEEGVKKMKKNMTIFFIGLVTIFVLLGFFVNYQNNKLAEENPYGKSSLHPETVEQLDDPNYQNQILPDILDEQLTDQEDVTVYFYSPTCGYCKQTTPIIVPLAEEMGMDLKKLNLLEFREAWSTFNIESTPTVVHYEDGKEVARVKGADVNFERFFNTYVLDNE